MKTIYEYLTIPVIAVLELTDANEKPEGSYLCDDANVRIFRRAIDGGYRWIRTDGEFAVFERIKKMYPAVEAR